MFAFTQEDCLPHHSGASLMGKVVVQTAEAADKSDVGQLFFCVNDSALGDLSSPFIPAWSLLTGELEYLEKKHLLGILRPNRLPTDAALQLSQIRPPENDEELGPLSLYTGYCYHPDGKMAAGIPLHGWLAALDYARMQAPYQYAVRVFDEDDHCVLEMQHGENTFIDPP